MKTHSAEHAQPIKEELSEEEIARINWSKERLQFLIDKATTMVNMALQKKSILELDGARLYKFVEKSGEEAGAVSESENSADEIVGYIEILCDKVKFPEDIKKEEGVENTVNLLLKKFDELEQSEQKEAYGTATQDIDGQLQKRGKGKRKGGFLGR